MTLGKIKRAALCGAGLAALLGGPALADEDAPYYSKTLFGDLGGLRKAFKDLGGEININENSEVFANPFGGIRPGANYDGVTQANIKFETTKFWKGGTFYASALQLHGENYSVDNIGALQTISGFQGDRATRLWEIWYDQAIGDHFDLKVGQQSLDNEFAQAPSGAMFVNSLFGWPALHALDMPDGGPAYPLASLGVRGAFKLGDNWKVLAGVYSGEPALDNNPDPQLANRGGVQFPIHGALAIAEAQYTWGDRDKAYGGNYLVGAWYDSLSFADQRYNTLGQPLADPAVDPNPRSHRGNFGFYAVADQLVWRDKEGRKLNLFIRPQIAPQSDRNLVTFALNGGLTLNAPFTTRPDDVFGLGFGVVEIGAGAVGASGDVGLYNPGAFAPKLSYETVLEASYQYQATPWMVVQPDLQYVINPGGGVANPDHPDRRIGDALVGGVRVAISF